MNFLKRAWLYMIRKKGKSILLFIVLLLIATFVLTALSIGKAADTAQQNLRQSLGGHFSIAFDYSENNPYLQVEQVEGGTIMYSTQQISPELVEKIRAIDGVKSCNAAVESLVNCSKLQFFVGNIALDEEFSKSAKITGVWKSEENGLFTSGKIELVEGRHITPQDENKILVSKDLADKNGLKIGDFIKTDKNIDLEIVGLFSPHEIEAFNEQVTTYDKIQNLIISDLAAVVALENGPAIQGFNELTVSVSDPQNMEKIISEVRKIDDVDWNGFSVTQDTEGYDHAADSLQQLSGLVSTILVVVLIVSVAILSLMLTMWARTRIHETGILLSVGIKKLSILGQYITEVLLIAIVAFSLSCFPSYLIANQVGEILQTDQVISDIQTDEDGNIAEGKNGVDTSINGEQPQADISDLEITIQTEQVALLFFIGIGVVVLSAGISSISVMRLKPREILSRMS